MNYHGWVYLDINSGLSAWAESEEDWIIEVLGRIAAFSIVFQEPKATVELQL